MSAEKPLALIAEDTELGRWAVAHALKQRGFEVEVASSWWEVLASLAHRRFDLLVVAVSSEQTQFADVCTLLARDQPSLRIIALAPSDQVGQVKELWASRAVVMSKPLDVEQVVHVAISDVRPAASV